jgi:hypothetical protein
METTMKVVKTDGYNDIFNGSSSGAPQPFFMQGNNYLIGQFYNENAIAKRIVDVVPEEMVTAGFKVTGVEDESEFRSKWDDLDLNSKLTEALVWSNLFGGSAVVLLLKDGRRLTNPAREGAELEDVRIYDRFQVRVKSRDANPRSVRYGKPEIYTIMAESDIGEYDVHWSRVHICDGERVTPQVRKANGGWGGSVLNKSLIEAIYDYDYSEQLSTQLLRRMQQAVWGAKGLAELCEDDEGTYAARVRLAQVDNNSGVGNAIGIDASEETFTLLNGSISGVPEFLESKFNRIVALSGIHEIILKGKNVGGVSASQNTALETYYKLVERKREEDYRPLLEFLLPYVISETEWSIEFSPLSVPSNKDVADILEKNVASVVAAKSAGVIDNEEARDTLRSISPELKLKDGEIQAVAQAVQQEEVTVL